MTSLIAAAALFLPAFAPAQTNPGARRSFNSATPVIVTRGPQVKPTTTLQPGPILNRNAASKISAAKSLLKIPLVNPGLTGLATLTVRNPYSAGIANISFKDFGSFETSMEPYGWATEFESSNAFMEIRLKIAKPGKVHMLTFYVQAWAAQSIRIKRVNTPSQFYNVNAGAQSMVFAFIPTAAGNTNIYFNPKKSLSFFKLELDVAD